MLLEVSCSDEGSNEGDSSHSGGNISSTLWSGVVCVVGAGVRVGENHIVVTSVPGTGWEAFSDSPGLWDRCGGGAIGGSAISSGGQMSGIADTRVRVGDTKLHASSTRNSWNV